MQSTRAVTNPQPPEKQRYFPWKPIPWGTDNKLRACPSWGLLVALQGLYHCLAHHGMEARRDGTRDATLEQGLQGDEGQGGRYTLQKEWMGFCRGSR